MLSGSCSYTHTHVEVRTLVQGQKKSYLIMHPTGVLSCTDTLEMPEGMEYAAAIDLETMEVCLDGEWQKIPEGFESLKAAETLLSEYEEEEEQETEQEDYAEEDVLLFLPVGAKRVVSPELVWKYCRSSTGGY